MFPKKTVLSALTLTRYCSASSVHESIWTNQRFENTPPSVEEVEKCLASLERELKIKSRRIPLEELLKYGRPLFGTTSTVPLQHHYRLTLRGLLSRLSPSYESRKASIAKVYLNNARPVRMRKRTSSNLFRYKERCKKYLKTIDLRDFNHVLNIEEETRILDVEGLTTYDEIVAYTLPRGLLPTVTPELKHITIGGAIVGIGIESSCFRHGFVHDGLLEADVLLPGGKIVTCRPNNEYSDLLAGLPNSYGTLGYVIRATIKLMPARQFVLITNTRFNSLVDYIDAMKVATQDDTNDFVEGLFYAPNELYLTIGQMVDEASQTRDIYRKDIYYKLLRRDTRFYLDTADYIFRYDPDWFWNVPEGGLYDLFRRLAPRFLRNSGFYNRYVATKRKLQKQIGYVGSEAEEQLIQDWQIPWGNAAEFLMYALDNVDLQGQPWVAAPICPHTSATIYPIKPEALYFNVGCYCFTKKPLADEDFYYTRLLDRKCFQLGGIKMLYSSTFIEREEFDALYAGSLYRDLKSKYDPAGDAPGLFEKAVLGS